MLRKIKNRVRRLLEARQRASLFGDLAPMVPPVWMMFDGGTSKNLRRTAKSF
jgi:hypothetical protein